tara:strand:- start:64 stop:540 length:477 start_codon:yes stop_codon:yes gene_type:complete
MVQTKEERAIKKREWYLKNKEKISKEGKEFYIDNRDKICLQKKIHYINNREKICLQKKIYRSENHKICTINRWKKQGLKSEIYSAIYDYYNGVLNCERCGVTLTTGERCKTTKCMDHCHESGMFRDVICNSCNASLPRQTEFNPCKPSANTLEVVKEV